MYIPDLAELSVSAKLSVLAVGWLHPSVAFKMSDREDQELVTKLQHLIEATIANERAVHRTRGIHRCQLCNDKRFGSNAAILIPSLSPGCYFVTNFLIAHYVSIHLYAPPAQFVASLQSFDSNCDAPEGSVEKSFKIWSREGDDLEQRDLESALADFPELLKQIRDGKK